MATKKITELVEIISAANDDVLPIVDISTDITNKIKVENLPISTSVQTALNGKENTIGYTTENVANKSTSVTTDQASNTKYPSVKAVYDWAVGLFATLSQLATKQDTLVSGTNIKTINSTSLLGSGNISISANPSGGAGAIQFSNGSAFASDSNLFWDNTNKRLGVGESVPTATMQIKGVGTTTATTSLLIQNSVGDELLRVLDQTNAQPVRMPSARIGTLNLVSSTVLENTSHRLVATSGGVSVNSDYSFPASGTMFQVKGRGSTSATTALRVENSAGTALLTVNDAGAATVASTLTCNSIIDVQGLVIGTGQRRLYSSSSSNANLVINTTGILASTSGFVASNASAVLEVVSTTQGFLPPRMTTTQKNAISTPAAGLQVYDTTLNQMSYYNGTNWVNF